MKQVILNNDELTTYRIVKKLVEEKGNKKKAAIKLNCSIKTINRYIEKYKKFGKAGFKHGNSGREPVNKISDSDKNRIVLLYVDKYESANLIHFVELLAERENIFVSDSTVSKILNDFNILSPKAHKETKRKLKKKLENEKLQGKSKSLSMEIQLSIDLLDRNDAHPRRPRVANFGELIQMDASEHIWFGTIKTHLHLAIDDATGMIVGAYFALQETLDGYYNVFYQILTNYGIPFKFLTDRRTVFEYKKKNAPSDEEDTFTQFSYACHQLGVEIDTSSVPQAKGRVERLNQTLQSRLPLELKINNINSIEQANEFLIDYIKVFNKKFSVEINITRTVFEESPKHEIINTTLAVLVRRKVDNGHCVKFENSYYLPTTSLGADVYHQKGTPAIVIKAFDGKTYVNIQNEIYILRKIEERLDISPNFDDVKEPQIRKHYIPPMSHPWKSMSFEKFINKQKHRIS